MSVFQSIIYTYTVYGVHRSVVAYSEQVQIVVLSGQSGIICVIFPLPQSVLSAPLVG